MDNSSQAVVEHSQPLHYMDSACVNLTRTAAYTPKLCASILGKDRSNVTFPQKRRGKRYGESNLFPFTHENGLHASENDVGHNSQLTSSCALWCSRAVRTSYPSRWRTGPTPSVTSAFSAKVPSHYHACLLYTSDAADDTPC
eukprot:884525-Pyramimonas_sp.AAC.1